MIQRVLGLDLLVHSGKGGIMMVAAKGDSSWERQLVGGWKLRLIHFKIGNVDTDDGWEL